MAPKNNKTPFYLIDTGSTFYKPMWIRAVICVLVALWAALEVFAKNPFWSVISLALAVYCVYVLFISYKPPVEQPVVARPDDEDDDADSDAPKAE
ncbi:hypothetical protein JJB09_21715 [Rhizobium sp. KVB221]|uniref:DUF3329 domain-containing protein n=1 Tax=Rhizobium setariae TaxID=2801340 RepID=A0A937CQK9_9HYPH|nr:hypothetical protein [Rhizobium setariae]MBL0374634.1 hypothetical protein [Rhizobium setariae]